MPSHDFWTYDHAVQGATDLSAGVQPLTSYVENGLYNQYTGLPGMLFKNTSGTGVIGTDGFLTLTTASGFNPMLLVQAKEVQDWSSATTKYWMGFRTKTSAQNGAACNIFALVDGLAYTNFSALLQETDMTAAGAAVLNTEYYVEVMIDRTNLLFEVWVNGVKIKNGSLPAAVLPAGGNGYYQWGAFNSQSGVTNGSTRSFRDYYFVDVDATQTPSRLGSVRSSAQPQPSASTPNPLTLYNSASISTAQSKFGGSSLLMGAPSNTGAMLADRPSLRLGVSSDCTIECWCMSTNNAQIGVLFSKDNGASPYAHFTYNNNQWQWYADSGSVMIAPASGVAVNTWMHIALVRQGTTWTLYQNGISLGSSSASATFGNNTLPFIVGNYGALSAPWQGYIDEFRISNVARYTGNFTPPSAAFTPDANTVALWHMDSVDAFNRVADAAPQTIPNAVVTAPNTTGYSAQLIGTAAQTTAAAKFGTASLTLGGTTGTAGSCAQIPDAPNLRLTGDYTIEFFAFSPTLGGSQMYVNKGTNAYFFMSGTQLMISLDPSNTAVITVNAALKAGVWQHIALTRLGTLVTLWVDGVAVGTLNTLPGNSNFGNLASPFQIGTWTNNSDLFQGNLDEFRVSNVARYTAAFTPPSQAFVADANTVVLLHFEAVVGNLLADDAVTFSTLEAQPLPSPPGVAPYVASAPTNDPMTVPFSSTNFTGKCLAVDFRLAAKASNNPVSMAASLTQGSNNQALTTQQFADTSMNFGRRLGLQQTAPDGGVWTPAKINATSLTLTPNT